LLVPLKRISASIGAKAKAKTKAEVKQSTLNSINCWRSQQHKHPMAQPLDSRNALAYEMNATARELNEKV